jgi:muramoyltetrapeptide carboxypeptidase
MIAPPFLKKDSLVAIVAPAGKLKSSLDDAIRILEGWGLKCVVGKNVFSNNHSYLSGTDEERREDLQAALDDENVEAILCARGGYGITRILDRLDFTTFLKRPKWIVGFSDITAIHLQLNRLGIESIHGTMPLLFTIASAKTSGESLRRVLFGDTQNITTNYNQHNINGSGTGEVLGGNLSLIVDSIGTSSEPELNSKILILEEIEEYKYKIDRMMTHLKRSGKLKNLAGLVVGHMTNILDTETAFGESIESIILDKVKEYDFPVAFGFPVGHDYPNMAFRCGSKMKLKVAATGSELTTLFDKDFF